MLLITQYFWIIHLTTDETLSVEDGVFRVGVEGVLGGITDTKSTISGRSFRTVKSLTYSRSSSVKETHEGVIR